MGSHSSQDFSLFLYSHLPDGTGGFVIEADHTVSTKGLYLAFIDNPQTGEAIKIAASKAPKFKAGKALKDLVNKK